MLVCCNPCEHPLSPRAAPLSLPQMELVRIVLHCSYIDCQFNVYFSTFKSIRSIIHEASSLKCPLFRWDPPLFTPIYTLQHPIPWVYIYRHFNPRWPLGLNTTDKCQINLGKSNLPVSFEIPCNHGHFTNSD